MIPITIVKKEFSYNIDHLIIYELFKKNLHLYGLLKKDRSFF
jgi:hypothetical protein